MIDINELNRMLDDALESESVESLNLWMEERIKEDCDAGIIRNAEFGILSSSWGNPNSLTESQENVIENGLYEAISYHTSDALPDVQEFELNSDNNYNLAA
ncbi:MAG: hypothetical protein K2H92_03960 [Bacteroidaceae bacterium]|nr:hypothetical protein [Bacteroidaceae bacterium]